MGIKERGGCPKFADYMDARQRVVRGNRPSIPDAAAPLVTIVTATFNSERTLQRTIDSINLQKYPNIEYIIVDGGSTDGTLDVIARNLNAVSAWISERDGGIYEAFNKGAALANGDYVAFLNSDDAYSDDQVETAVHALERSGSLWVFGNMTMHGFRGQDIYLPGDADYSSKIRLTMPALFQVTVLAHRSIFAHVGLFRTDYRIASDYDWFLRVALAGIPGVYAPTLHGHMWAGGASTNRQRLALREGFLISMRNGCPVTAAVPHWGLRYLFPDGVPSRAQAMVDRFSRILRLGIQPLVASPIASAKLPPRAAWEAKQRMAAFLDAQEAGDALSDQTLIGIMEMLAGAPDKFALVGDGPGFDQVEALISGLGLAPCPVEDAWVAFVLDRDALHRDQIGGRIIVQLDPEANHDLVAPGTVPIGQFGNALVVRSGAVRAS